MAVFAQQGGDLQISSGQLVILTDPAECAATELRNKFLFVQGEYFLDQREGIPYFQIVFVKNPNLFVIRSVFSRIILAQSGVASLLSIDVSRTPDRKGKFSFRALSVNGRVISGGSDQPFIVEV